MDLLLLLLLSEAGMKMKMKMGRNGNWLEDGIHGSSYCHGSYSAANGHYGTIVGRQAGQG